MATKHPWDQLPGETTEAYSRFLWYRNAGITRTFRKAYCKYLQAHDGYTGGIRGLHVPGQWTEDSRRHFWTARARQWDVHSLNAYGAKIAILQVIAITRLAERNAKAAGELAFDDPGFAGLMKSVDAVAKFLTPELIDGIARGRDGGPVPAAAAVAGGDGDRAGVA